VSPVLDVSRHLSVIEYQGGEILKRVTAFLPEEETYHRACRIESLKVDLLICGAVSNSLREMLESRGIQLVSFVSGDIEDVLSAWLQGKLPRPELTMPGCHRGRGCGRRNGGCHRGQNRLKRHPK